MKAFRVYFIERNERIYCCNQPGYWSHHCASPEYAIPFLVKEEAEGYAKVQEKYVAPSGEKRYIEEYEETRDLVANKYDGNVTFAEFMCYHTDRCCYKPV